MTHAARRKTGGHPYAQPPQRPVGQGVVPAVADRGDVAFLHRLVSLPTNSVRLEDDRLEIVPENGVP